MYQLLGAEACGQFQAALEQPTPVSIRLNPRKVLSFQGLPGSVSSSPVPWHPLGFYLAERPVFTLDPAFHAGAYYVQEALAMWEPRIQVTNVQVDIDPDNQERMLITIDYEIKATHDSRSLVFPFYHIPGE